MKYAIYQMDVADANPEKNRQKITEWVREVSKRDNPDTVILPEMWNTGYALDSLRDLADEDGEPAKSFLSELAKTYSLNIIGGSVGNKQDGNFYNTSYVFDHHGTLVHEYSKIHLVPMLNEHHYLTGGTEKAHIFELDGVKMGLIICFDLRFPELARKLALEGAQVLHIVAQWPSVRKAHWQYLQIARAIENQCFVISANTVGDYNGDPFAGTSMIIDPLGNEIAAGSQTNEETVTAAIDLDIVPGIRMDVPVFASRVPELYN